MGDWISSLIKDIKKGSITQFVLTIVLAVAITGYQLTLMIHPITSTAIMYWEGGITDAELERSNFYKLCEKLNSWPTNVFAKKNVILDEKCKMLVSRHMVRTADDWREYQSRAMAILNSKAKMKPVNNIPTNPRPVPEPPLPDVVLPNATVKKETYKERH